MRLSTNLLFSRGLTSVLNTQQELAKVQDQISKQSKILSPADDPIGNSQVMALDERIAQNDQFERNSVTLENNLKREDSVLGSINNAVNRARQLAVQAGSGTNSPEDRAALALELESLEQEIFDLMNSQDESGEYIFGGYQNRQQPFSYDRDTQSYVYNNDDGQRLLQLSPSLKLAAGNPGSEAFGIVSKRVDISSQASSTLPVQTLDISNRDQFLALTEDRYDAATPANNQLSVEFLAGNQFRVVHPVDGEIVPPTAYVPGEGVSFNGLTVEYSGTAVAGDQIDIEFGEAVPRNIATVVGDLARSLRDSGPGTDNQYRDEIDNALTDLSSSIDKLVTTRADVGARLNVLENTRSSNFDFQIVNKEARGSIQDIDYSTAITDLLKNETVLSASQQVFTRINNLTLFDYLR